MAEPHPIRAVSPLDLVVRCYLRRRRDPEGGWVAHCIDWDLWAVGPTPDAARRSMEDALVSYVETVLDTDDRGSIPGLLQRRASWRYVLFWHYLRLRSKMRNGGGMPLDSEPFQEALPFQLAHV